MIVSKWCIKFFIGWNSCHQLLLKIIESINIIYFNESFRDLWTYFHWTLEPTVNELPVWSGLIDIVPDNLSVDLFPESIKTHMLIDQAQSMTKQM